MTARHSPLFTLRSGQSGLGIYTTERDAAWGGLRQFKLRGTGNVSAVFGLHVIAYNLIRLGNLLKPAMATA